MGVQPEQLAASALADYLRATLPAKVTAVNLLRAAVLKARTDGPYVISGAMAHLMLSKTTRAAATMAIINEGTRTATQVATDINLAIPAFASAEDGRLVLTGDAPSGSTPSIVAVGVQTDSPVGQNSAFGWDAGGEHVLNAALVAPNWKGVADGWPVIPDMGPGFHVVIGTSETAPVDPDVRRDKHVVRLDVGVFYAPRQGEVHRNREPIRACVRCVREVLFTDAGRQLGRASNGDIMMVRVGRVKINGAAFQFKENESPINPFFDVANMQLEVGVFERPAAS